MNQTFEQSLARLEEIVDIIERGDTSLDEAICLYKEGLSLSKDCGQRLNRYETEITALQRESADFVLKPFESAAEV